MALIVDRLAYGVGYDLSAMAAGETAIKGSLARVAGFMKSPLGIALGVGIAVGSIGMKASKAASEWGAAWREVKTILVGTDEQLARIEDRVLKVTSRVPLDQKLFARGFYQSISSGITDMNDALLFTEEASKAAVAGLTDVFTAVDAGTTVINAYGMKAQDAAHIFDVLFSVVRDGKIVFEQVAREIGDVIPLYAQAGIPLEQFAAGISTLTKIMPPPIALTAMRSMINQVLGQTRETQMVAKELGIDFSITAMRAKGLAGFMREVIDASEGNSQAIKALFPDVRGLIAALAFAGKSWETLNRFQEMYSTGGVAGAASRAFEIQAESISAQTQMIKNEWNTLWIELGREINPNVIAIIKWLRAPIGKTVPEEEAFGVRLDNVRIFTEQIKAVEGPMGKLIEEYKALSEVGVRTNVQQARFLEIGNQLAEMFPELRAGVDEYGNSTGIATDKIDMVIARLRGIRDERFIDVWDDLSEKADLYRKRLADVNRELEINQQRQATGKGPAFWDGMTLKLTPSEEEIRKQARESLLDLGDKYREEGAKLEGTITRQAGALLARGLAGDVRTWVDLRKQVRETGDVASKEAVQLEALTMQLREIGVITGDDLDAMEEALDRIARRAESTVARIEGAPDVKDPNAEAAIKAYTDQLEKESIALAAFMSKALGTTITQAILVNLKLAEPAVVQYWQQRMDDARSAAQKAADDALKIEEEKFDRMRDLQRSSLEEWIELHKEYAATAAEIWANEFSGPSVFDLTGTKPPEPGAPVGVALPMMDAEEAALVVERMRILVGDKADAMMADFTMAMNTGNGLAELIAKIPAKHREAILQLLRGTINSVQGLDPGVQAGMENLIDSFLELDVATETAQHIQNLGQGLVLLGESMDLLDEKASKMIGGLIQAGSAIAANPTDPWALGGAGLGFFAGFLSEITKKTADWTEAMDRINDEMERFVRNADTSGGDLTEAYVLLRSIVNGGWENPSFFRWIERFEEITGIDLPEGVAAWDAANKLLGQFAQAMKDVGEFVIDTLGDALNEIHYLMEFYDLDGPIEKMEFLLQQLKELAGIDLTDLLGLSPEKQEKALEMLMQVITGTGSGEGLKNLLGNYQTAETPEWRAYWMSRIMENAMVGMLAETLGLPLEDVVALLLSILENDLASTGDLQDLLAELEGLNDEIQDQGDAAEDAADEQERFSRNVSITEDQGRTLISLGSSQLAVAVSSHDHLRALRDHAVLLLEYVRRMTLGIDPISGERGGTEASTIKVEVNVNGGGGDVDRIAAGAREGAAAGAREAMSRSLFRGVVRRPGGRV